MHTVAVTGSLPTWLSGEPRKALRHPIELKVAVAGLRSGEVSVMVTDISPLGCRVTGPLKASTGAFVTVAVPNFTGFTAWVAWHRGQDYGLDFAHPLPTPVVDYLIQRAEHDSEQ